MTQLISNSYVDSNNSPMYEIVLNDGGAGGGDGHIFTIFPSVGWPTREVMDAAVQAFADVLCTVENSRLLWIHRITLNEEDI